MIKNIIDLLQVVEGDTENIRIAQGKNALPTNVKNGLKLLKKTNKMGLTKTFTLKFRGKLQRVLKKVLMTLLRLNRKTS